MSTRHLREGLTNLRTLNIRHGVAGDRSAAPPQKSNETTEKMVTPAGLEPATYPLGGDCSIQLSHGA